jgi:hypothetical protein
MAKFNLKSEYFTAPIKAVLPGIIISVIGATSAYYIFNNPEKTKAKSTYATWKVINQFEEMLNVSSELLPCRSATGNEIQMKKDFIHLYEMTRQNLVDLKSEEKLDKRLSAVLNLKIDTYDELKKQTEVFLDSAGLVQLMAKNKELDSSNQNGIISGMQTRYINNLNHVVYRDTSMINSILGQLNQSYSSYVDSFLVAAEKIQSFEEVKKLITGTWLSTNVTFEFKPGGSGNWVETDLKTGEENNLDLTWTIKDALVTISLENGKQREFLIQKVGAELMTFSFADKANNIITANACRIK